MSEMSDSERARFFEKALYKERAEKERFKKLLCEAHALIGRLTHQLSKRWDVAPITEWMKDLLE